MTDPVIREAIRIRDALRSDTEIRGVAVEQACEMLQKLGTEVTRLRESVLTWSHGRMSREELIRVAQTWNKQP